jgi:hypothetical protein
MLTRLADLMRLRTMADASVQPARAAPPISDRELEPGAVVRAQVIAALPRGLFEVRIMDRSFVLRLPYKAESGDQLRLVVTSREPQLKFALAEREDSLGSATRLSETAHFVSSLLNSDEPLPLADSARLREPLISGPEVTAAQFAQSLRRALAQSGIFYEAHQAEWVAGQRHLDELLKEPQAQLAPLQHINERRKNEVLPPRADPPVHREALAIVRQQLDTLDTRHIAWHGVAWPGQLMDWHVGEQPDRQNESGADSQWHTSLQLELPRLGGVDAVIGIGSGAVSIALRAGSAETSALMHSGVEALKKSLNAAGITSVNIVVHQHGSS